MLEEILKLPCQVDLSHTQHDSAFVISLHYSKRYLEGFMGKNISILRQVGRKASLSLSYGGLT